MKKLLFIFLILAFDIGCQKPKQDDLSVSVYIPNAFRPNNKDGAPNSTAPCTDGEPNCNKVFKVIISNPNNIALKVSINIFNSNGILLYKSLDYSEGWNGQIHNTGEFCPQGNYRYLIKVTEVANDKSKIFEGDIALLR